MQRKRIISQLFSFCQLLTAFRIYLNMDNSIFEMFSKMLMGGFGQNNMSGGQNNSQASTSGQNNSNPAFNYYPGDIHNSAEENQRETSQNNQNNNFFNNQNFNNQNNGNFFNNQNFNNQNMMPMLLSLLSGKNQSLSDLMSGIAGVASKKEDSSSGSDESSPKDDLIL